MAEAVDLEAYFARIGHRGLRAATLETLTALHRRHPEAVPFESLDPLLGRGVAIDPASLEAKLVRAGRGGYCFEMNGLLLQVLTGLGFAVTPLAARVRWMLPDDAPPTALSHMTLKVDLPEGAYLADVGFGGQSPTAPIRLEPGLEQETPHGAYRVTEAGGAFDLQMRLPGRWQTMYRFTLQPQTRTDYEVFNWFTSTHPRSRFTNNLVASRVDGPRRLNLFNTELTVHGPGDAVESRVVADARELHRVLAHDFRIAVDLADVERLFDRLPRPAEPA